MTKNHCRAAIRLITVILYAFIAAGIIVEILKLTA
jgi:hypothetical protein